MIALHKDIISDEQRELKWVFNPLSPCLTKSFREEKISVRWNLNVQLLEDIYKGIVVFNCTFWHINEYLLILFLQKTPTCSKDFSKDPFNYPLFSLINLFIIPDKKWQVNMNSVTFKFSFLDIKLLIIRHLCVYVVICTQASKSLVLGRNSSVFV